VCTDCGTGDSHTKIIGHCPDEGLLSRPSHPLLRLNLSVIASRYCNEDSELCLRMHEPMKTLCSGEHFQPSWTSLASLQATQRSHGSQILEVETAQSFYFRIEAHSTCVVTTVFAACYGSRNPQEVLIRRSGHENQKKCCSGKSGTQC
jgi:hypothetical protein